MKACLAVSTASCALSLLLLLAAPVTSRADNLFVGVSSGIEEFNSSGVGTVFAVGLDVPRGLAFDSAGNLYVANQDNNTIEEFNSSSGVLNSNGTVFANFSAGLRQPFSLAFDSAGILYAANWSPYYNIVEFNSSGVGTNFTNSGLSGPSGLAFDNSGNLYVANYFYVANYLSSTIVEFNSVDGVLNSNGTVFASSGLDGASGLAFDSNGNLFVANAFNNTITEFNSMGGALNSNGTVFASFGSGLHRPTSAASNLI